MGGERGVVVWRWGVRGGGGGDLVAGMSERTRAVEGAGVGLRGVGLYRAEGLETCVQCEVGVLSVAFYCYNICLSVIALLSLAPLLSRARCLRKLECYW